MAVLKHECIRRGPETLLNGGADGVMRSVTHRLEFPWFTLTLGWTSWTKAGPYGHMDEPQLEVRFHVVRHRHPR